MNSICHRPELSLAFQHMEQSTLISRVVAFEFAIVANPNVLSAIVCCDDVLRIRLQFHLTNLVRFVMVHEFVYFIFVMRDCTNNYLFINHAHRIVNTI